MGDSPKLAYVRREKLAACMTCPICKDLLRDATALADCLHTFCRDCVMKKITVEDVDCCPVCNIDLGVDPEEKLRPDHNLQGIRSKLFPIQMDSSKASTTILPACRKQKVVSSSVDTPKVQIKAGLTGREAKRGEAPSPTTESQDHTTQLKKPAPPSTKVATAENKKKHSADLDAPKKALLEDMKNGKTTDEEEIRKPSKMKSPRSSPKIRAVTEELIKNKECELPIRKDDTEFEEVSSRIRVQTHSNKSRLEEGKKGGSSESTSSNEITRGEDNSTQGSLSVSTNDLHGAITTPVWFSLVALPNQDGSLQVSSVQKYIMTKLDLANEDEVEIICQGEPICPYSTLHGLVDLWVRRAGRAHPSVPGRTGQGVGHGAGLPPPPA